MNQHVVYSELMNHIGDCIPNLKSILEETIELKSALFFPTMLNGNEVYIQPLMIPVAVANELMTMFLKKNRFEDDDRFSDYILKGFNLLRLNSIEPAPTTFHCQFLEIFETIMINGLRNHDDEIAKLCNLRIGDLAIMQVEISGNQLTSGLTVISNALELYNICDGGNVITQNYTVH